MENAFLDIKIQPRMDLVWLAPETSQESLDMCKWKQRLANLGTLNQPIGLISSQDDHWNWVLFKIWSQSHPLMRQLYGFYGFYGRYGGLVIVTDQLKQVPKICDK